MKTSVNRTALSNSLFMDENYVRHLKEKKINKGTLNFNLKNESYLSSPTKLLYANFISINGS